MNNKTFSLCESIDEQGLEALDRNLWLANEKYDGCRCMCVKKGEEIIMFGRRNEIMTQQFPEIISELKQIEKDFIIDSEIIAFDGDFNKLQSRALTKNPFRREQLIKEIPCKMVAFDILSINNNEITSMPLKERIIYLNSLIDKDFKHLEIAEYDDINNMLSRVIEKNGEGIVIKRMDKPYINGRHHFQMKYKLFKEGYLTINAYTINPKGIRATDKDNNAVQISGKQSQEVKEMIEKNGYAEICIQYLQKTKDERYRFISYRGLK